MTQIEYTDLQDLDREGQIIMQLSKKEARTVKCNKFMGRWQNHNSRNV